MEANQYDEAVSQYTAALSLDPRSPQDLLVKRSKAHADKAEWEDALNDANQVVFFFNSFNFVHADEHCSGNRSWSILFIGLREEIHSATWYGAQ